MYYDERMNVLIVEDNHKIARVISEGMQQEGFTAEVCYNGEDGLAAAQRKEHDLIILDAALPGPVDGATLCRTLRDEGNHVPLLMLMAKRDRAGRRASGSQSGADDYLVKPFAFEELFFRVRALLRRPQDKVEDELRADDLRLNPLTKQAFRGDTSLSLSKKECAVLEYLLRNKGKVLSKQAIINRVWHFDADVLPGTIDVVILYLRNKVDRPFADKPNLIVTVRGFGYRIG
jgi:two-component system OmpR family response regulator